MSIKGLTLTHETETHPGASSVQSKQSWIFKKDVLNLKKLLNLIQYISTHFKASASALGILEQAGSLWGGLKFMDDILGHIFLPCVLITAKNRLDFYQRKEAGVHFVCQGSVGQIRIQRDLKAKKDIIFNSNL